MLDYYNLPENLCLICFFPANEYILLKPCSQCKAKLHLIYISRSVRCFVDWFRPFWRTCFYTMVFLCLERGQSNLLAYKCDINTGLVYKERLISNFRKQIILCFSTGSLVKLLTREIKKSHFSLHSVHTSLSFRVAYFL